MKGELKVISITAQVYPLQDSESHEGRIERSSTVKSSVDHVRNLMKGELKAELHVLSQYGPHVESHEGRIESLRARDLPDELVYVGIS